MDTASPLEVLRAGLNCAYYMAFIVMMVLALTLISAEMNKLILFYRDTVNRLGAGDRSLPPKVIAYLGMAVFTAGLVLSKPFFVGIGVLSSPLVVFNLRELSRTDIWNRAEDDRRPPV